MAQVGSAEWKANVSAGMVLAHAEKRAGGFKPGNTAGRKVTARGRKRCVDAAVAVTTGAGGFGKMKRGRDDHQFAAAWVIESPDGEVFEVRNLRQWCRANEHRFEALSGSAMPTWERAASGMRAAAPGNRYGRYHWKGWRVVEVRPVEQMV